MFHISPGLGQIERNSYRQTPSSSSAANANGQPSQVPQGQGPSANVMPVVGSERPSGPPSMVGAGVLATGKTNELIIYQLSLHDSLSCTLPHYQHTLSYL